MRKYTEMVDLDVARRVVRDLIECSCWFSVEPLPDDLYEISVKEELKNMLNKLAFCHSVEVNEEMYYE